MRVPNELTSEGEPLQLFDPVVDAPDLGEQSLNLFTLPYVQLVEALADIFYPPNSVMTSRGPRLIRASNARVDRYILFRAAWQPEWGKALQLALRDLSAACLARHSLPFVKLDDAKRNELVSLLEKGGLASTEWLAPRPQRSAFSLLKDAVMGGLMAEPGYGGNAGGLGWAYTNFYRLDDRR